MIGTSEYRFLNPKLNEIIDIINNTQLEHDQKYGDDYCRKIEVRCKIEFSDKIKNKTKNITINHYCIHRGIEKMIVASQGRYELLRPNKLINLIEEIFTKIL